MLRTSGGPGGKVKVVVIDIIVIDIDIIVIDIDNVQIQNPIQGGIRLYNLLEMLQYIRQEGLKGCRRRSRLLQEVQKGFQGRLACVGKRVVAGEYGIS
mmetsp:Transcript_9057/g.14541  ORF Transcript_9057/g.14541 Transcript_9057/m.14541 type:complete len:98 (-) Transcript_9057:714-1007(-)